MQEETEALESTCQISCDSHSCSHSTTICPSGNSFLTETVSSSVLYQTARVGLLPGGLRKAEAQAGMASEVFARQT